jgi:hypothetical protein
LIFFVYPGPKACLPVGRGANKIKKAFLKIFDTQLFLFPLYRNILVEKFVLIATTGKKC